MKFKLAHFSYCRIDKNIREAMKKESSVVSWNKVPFESKFSII